LSFLPWFHFQKNTKSPFLQKIFLCVHIPYNIEHSLSERWKKKKENKKIILESLENLFLLFYVAYSFSPSFSLLPFVCAQNIFPFFLGEEWMVTVDDAYCVYVCRCVKFSKVVLVNVRNSSSSSSRDHQQVARFIFFWCQCNFFYSPDLRFFCSFLRFYLWLSRFLINFWAKIYANCEVIVGGLGFLSWKDLPFWLFLFCGLFLLPGRIKIGITEILSLLLILRTILIQISP